MTALPNYTPLLIGIFGAMMFQPGVMQAGADSGLA